MVKIAPSILSADFSYLLEQVAAAERGGASLLHLDVMDGHFVPNISFGPVVIEKIRPHSSLVFDVHLMIEHPERHIKAFADAGADMITVHEEATDNVVRCVDLIHSLGKKAGVAIKPATPVSAVFELLSRLDLVLVMAVEPGRGGQAYLPETDAKLQELRRVAGSGFDISVDGGVYLDNLAHVVRMGANVIVAGSAIFGSKDIERTVCEFNRTAGQSEFGPAESLWARYLPERVVQMAERSRRMVGEQ